MSSVYHRTTVYSFLPCVGNILEIGAQWAIAKKDVDMFERYMAQLKCYYLDYRFAFIICTILSCTGVHYILFVLVLMEFPVHILSSNNDSDLFLR